MIVRTFHIEDTDAVLALWRDCELTRPWNDPHADIRRKLTVQPELFLVGTENGSIVASVMAGFDGHRGWVNYLAVAPARRGGGLGRQLMAECESRLEQLGCPKLNIQVRAGNERALGFYRALGYVEDGSITLGKRLIAD